MSEQPEAGSVPVDGGDVSPAKSQGANSNPSDGYKEANPWRRKNPLWLAAIALLAAVVAVLVAATVNSDRALPGTVWVSVAGLATLLVGLKIVFDSTKKPRLRADLYDEVRKQIEHEDNLVNHRLSWLMTSQSFLFAAYALQYTKTDVDPKMPEPTPFVFHVIPIVALISAVLIYCSVTAAVGALENLRLSFAHSAPDTRGTVGSVLTFTDDSNLHMELSSTGRTLLAGLIAPLGIPIVLVCVWTLLIFSGTG